MIIWYKNIEWEERFGLSTMIIGIFCNIIVIELIYFTISKYGHNYLLAKNNLFYQ